jgi:hypothetical protein
MWVDIENRIKILDKKVEGILDNMPESAYDRVDKNKGIPLLSHLESEEYTNFEEGIFELRNEIISFFTKSTFDLRLEIINSLKKYEYFGLVFIPNKNALNNALNKADYLLSILITLSIQNLNDDIRDNIIYVNSLKELSKENEISFDDLLKKVILISSDIAEVYSISMKEFFECYLNKKSIPIEVKAK